MKYDDASWHYGGDFPSDLPPEAGATHIGMFVAWAFLEGLNNPEEDFDIEPLISRTKTPGAYLFDYLDGKFVESMLNEKGRRFAKLYFSLENEVYIQDYSRKLLNGLPTLYHVQDTWSNFDILKPMLDNRFSLVNSGIIPIKKMTGARGILQKATIAILNTVFKKHR